MKNFLATILAVFGILLVFEACKKDDELPPEPNPCERIFELDSVTAKPAIDNVLRYTIFVKTSEIVDAYIEYWPVGEAKKKSSVLSENQDEHEVPLINMTAETAYQYRIISTAGDCIFISDEYTFTTGELPIELPGINQNNISLDFEGYILTHTYLPGALFAIDHQGKIVWYELFNSAVLVSTITAKHSHITLLGSGDYVEMDFFGNELRSYEYLVDYNHILHHEIFTNTADEAVVLTKHDEAFDFSGIGGDVSDRVYSDGIITFAADGTETWQWDIFDVIDPISDPIILSTKNDWTHSNAVAYDTDGNMLLSIRNFNQIWKINRQDGSLMWKLGIDGDFAMDADDYFYQQHAVSLTPEGNLMLYDNGQNGIERSRALIFDLDETAMTASTKVKIELPSNFYASRQSNCMLVDNDKMLFANTEQKAFIITDLSGDFLWHVNLESGSFYRGYYFEGFY